LQQTEGVLASIVLLVCLTALAVAAGIVFVVLGPIRVNRHVTMVSRISPPLPMATAPVAMPGMPVFDPAQATFSQPEEFSTERHAAFAVEPHAAAAFPAERHAEPPPPARKAKPLAPLAPAQLRRPRTAPSPLPRSRSARGTEPRNPALPERDPVVRGRQAFEVEHTAQDIPMFDADEMTFIEDDRS
jgi:hypothetical protein